MEAPPIIPIMSPRKKKIQNIAPHEIDPSSISIILRPIGGISPRFYVPFVWFIIVAVLVFFLLIFPGIRRNGTWITVYSDPPDASVLVDGQRLGRTYQPVFVSKGTREIRVRRPGFVDSVLTQRVGGRIFASRIFPRRGELVVRLTADEEKNHWALAIDEFAAWVATGSEEERYAIPPTLTPLGRDLSTSDFSDVGLEEAVRAILPLSRDNRQLAELNRGLYLVHSPQNLVNPIGLARYISRMAQIISDNSYTEGILDIAGVEEENITVPSTENLQNMYEEFAASNNVFPENLSGVELLRIGDIRMPIGDIEIVNLGDYRPRFGAVPVEASVREFRIGVYEVTNEEFAQFVQSVPQWQKANTVNLIKENLVDEGYLEDWPSTGGYPEGREEYPVVNISWYAAKAYTEWLSENLFPDSRFVIRLPREDEWEIAARLNSGVRDMEELSASLKTVRVADDGRVGLRGIVGNVREWCDNPFRYNENRFRPESGEARFTALDSLLKSNERTVRGGSFIDASLGLPYPVAVRGMLKGYQTSPVLGFRIAVVAR